MLDLILAFIAGWWLGSKITDLQNQMAFREILKDLGVSHEALKKLRDDHQEDSQSPEEIDLRIEQHGTELYAFRKDTDQFLAQAKDRDSLVQRIAETHKNVKFRVAEEDGAHLLKTS